MHKACIAHTTTQEVSVIRLSISSENYHILYRGLRKHFQICSSNDNKSLDTTNIEIYIFKSMVRRHSARFLRVVNNSDGVLKTITHTKMVWCGEYFRKIFVYLWESLGGVCCHPWQNKHKITPL